MIETIAGVLTIILVIGGLFMLYTLIPKYQNRRVNQVQPVVTPKVNVDYSYGRNYVYGTNNRYIDGPYDRRDHRDRRDYYDPPHRNDRRNRYDDRRELDDWNRRRRNRMRRGGKCDRVRKNLTKESSENDVDDDIYGDCSRASPLCRRHAECTNNKSFKSGCSAYLTDRNGKEKEFGCPSSCCFQNL